MIDFKKKQNLQRLQQWIGPRKQYSLRVIEFFFLHWSRRHSIFPNTHPFSVYSLYRKQLSLFKKINFDFFCRVRKDIIIHDIHTNQAQLNFFQWFFSSNLDRLLIQFYQEIRQEMYLKNKQSPHPPSTSSSTPNKNDPWDGVIREKLCMIFRF